jgi:anti-sigma-K factor RskA
MSDQPDDDLLAADYVLGSLEGEERRTAERLLATSATFARSVAAWQQRLTPLAAQVSPVAPPPDLWQRIAAAVSQSTEAEILPFRRRVRFWQGTTVAALAIAASLAAFVVLHQPEPQGIAVLSPMSGGTPMLIATTERSGVLIVQPTAPITVPADKDLELWALPQGATKPRSLGVLPPSGRRLAVQLASDTQLLVSLEPKGGSPTGQPTGPVLYGGSLLTAQVRRG